MKRASFREAIEWIAVNDEAGEDVPENPAAEQNIAGYISTALVADIFGTTVERVAYLVLRARRVAENKRRYAERKHPALKLPRYKGPT